VPVLMSDQPYQPDTWKVIIDGEIEDVYVKDDEVHVSGMCALSATEAVQFAEVLVRAAALLRRGDT